MNWAHQSDSVVVDVGWTGEKKCLVGGSDSEIESPPSWYLLQYVKEVEAVLYLQFFYILLSVRVVMK